MMRIVQPFASDDTYICPDCGSEVRVGARSCPGCGPFQPMTWSPDDDSGPYAQSAATLADRREAIRVPQAYLRRKRSEPVPFERPELRSRLSIPLLVVLGILTLIAATVILMKPFMG
ncbi:MAG TPA: hypothetical protein VIT91_01130 [Chthoniobacterales bacterium]